MLLSSSVCGVNPSTRTVVPDSVPEKIPFSESDADTTPGVCIARAVSARMSERSRASL
jgi:hypothetical protein